MWREAFGASRRKTMTPRTPRSMCKYIYGGIDGGGIGVTMQEDNVSVTGKRRLDSRSKHVLHRRHQIKTLDEYAMRKVNEKRGDQRSMELGGSEREKVVSQQASAIIRTSESQD
jgi:hypothetical protein